MSKKTEKKMAIRIDEASNAIIQVLCNHEHRHPGEYMRKDQLFALAITRAEYNIQVSDTDIHELEAIPAPDLNFFARKWPAICKYAARRHKRYIVWDTEHRTGVRIGTLEEYEKNQTALARIVAGIADCVEDRTRIIVSHGGQSFLINITVKQLNSGLEEQPA